MNARAMVASSQRYASEAGARVLEEGGTAADACVAMDAVLHVTEPTSTGLGGDAFALYFEAATGRIAALNASGRAPLALTHDAVIATQRSPSDGMWVTVPGCCAGWFDLVERFGSMPIARLLEPAIEFAEEGFAVGDVTAAIWARGLSQLQSDALKIDGRAPAASESFRNPALARTLRRLSRRGPKEFYEGETAALVVDAVRRAGGVMTRDDLARHSSTWDEPVSVAYRGARIWECPPNSQGIAALLALGVLDGLDLGKATDVQRWHLLIEAMRVAFADARAWVSDPGASDVSTDMLMAGDYLKARRQLVDPLRATQNVRQGAPVRRGGTVYHCAVDRAGNACSMASSHFMGFGTGVAPNECGFVLHNRGLGFSLDPASPNVVAPGKRPYHTVAPAMLTRQDGTLWGPFGVMGGFMQPQGHVQVVTALLDDGATPQEALDRPRFCIDAEASGGVVQLEEGVTDAVVNGLKERGHVVQAGIPSFGRALFGRGQIVLRDSDGLLVGGSDHRADGCVIEVG